MSAPTLPPAEHRNPIPLPTPRASFWRIVRTCVRRVTLPIELARVDARLEDAEFRAYRIGRQQRQAERDESINEAVWLADEGVALCGLIRNLKLRQLALEREARG
jgi:hypothetical protein